MLTKPLPAAWDWSEWKPVDRQKTQREAFSQAPPALLRPSLGTPFPAANCASDAPDSPREGPEEWRTNVNKHQLHEYER